MKLIKLLLATNNAKKVEEIRKILPDSFELLTLAEINFSEEIPETTNTIEGNSRQKAWFVYDRTHLNCLSDDSGLEIVALDGRPGVESAHYAGLPPNAQKNMDLVLEELDGVVNRKAQFVTVLTLILNGEEYQFKGVVEGRIGENPVGSYGFGYDPIFMPSGFDTTFAQMDNEVKNKISHRAIALQKLKDFMIAQKQ